MIRIYSLAFSTDLLRFFSVGTQLVYGVPKLETERNCRAKEYADDDASISFVCAFMLLRNVFGEKRTNRCSVCV